MRDVHAGSTVFVPAGTWIAMSNIRTDAINLVFIFSARGFNDYMRASSSREGEPTVSLSPAEDEEIQKAHAHDVIYKK